MSARKILRHIGYFLAGLVALCTAPLLLVAAVVILPFYDLGRTMLDEEYRKAHANDDDGGFGV